MNGEGERKVEQRIFEGGGAGRSSVGSKGTELRLLSHSGQTHPLTYTIDALRKLGLKGTPQQVLDPTAACAAGDAGTFSPLPWTTSLALDDPTAVSGDDGAETDAVRYWGRYPQDSAIDDLRKRQSASLDVAERRKLANDLDKGHLSAFITIKLGYTAATYVQAQQVHRRNYQLNDYTTTRQMDTVWMDA